MSADLWLWTAATYIIASIPFSLLIGRLFFGVDIREYGDGNPGATNVYRVSKSIFWLVIAVLLDGFKGLFPVGILYWIFGITDMRILPVAVAALMGHAFSLFLRFDGGKAVAITGGVWTGLLLFEAPLVIGVLLVYWYKSVDSSDWAIMLMMLSFLVYLLITRGLHPVFLSVWAANFAVLLYRHHDGLHQLPGIKRWLPFLSKNDSQDEAST